MKISAWKRLTKSDFDLPDWFEEIADRVNDQIERLTSALSGNWTFEDNALAEIRTLEMPHDTMVTIELQRLRRSPTGVLLLSTSEFDYARLAWRISEARERSIDVKVKFDTVPTRAPVVTLLVLG